jgi:Transposase
MQQRHSVEQIIAKLRRADVELGKDRKVPEVCEIVEITEQTYYRWRQKYGGMAPTMDYFHIHHGFRCIWSNARLKLEGAFLGGYYA